LLFLSQGVLKRIIDQAGTTDFNNMLRQASFVATKLQAHCKQIESKIGARREYDVCGVPTVSAVE
jgi:hypothetical protein